MRGDVHDKAVSYCRKAAAKAADRSAYREASAHLEDALAVLGRLPETRERVEQEIDLRLALRSSLFPLGEIARDLESLQAAEPLAESLPDRRRLAWVLTYMTRDLSILGQPDRAIECGERALGLVAGVEDRELEVLTPAYLGSVYFARGDYRQAADILRARLTTLTEGRLLERFGLPGPASVFFRVWLVSSLARLGEFEEGAAQAAESLRIARQADQPLARMVAHYTAGFLHAHAGDPPRAVQHLETSLDLCRTWKLAAWFSNIASILGYTYALSGRMDDGVSLMQQAIDSRGRPAAWSTTRARWYASPRPISWPGGSARRRSRESTPGSWPGPIGNPATKPSPFVCSGTSRPGAARRPPGPPAGTTSRRSSWPRRGGWLRSSRPARGAWPRWRGAGAADSRSQSLPSIVSASLTSNLPACSTFSALTTPSSTSIE